jgi:PD-(D/E)XK endonuclease
MMSTNHKGAIAETAITAEATRLGIEVYRPVAEGGRFDLIFVFADASPARVQCKWATKQGEVVVIRPYSCRRAREGLRVRAYAPEEIDAIAGYCMELNRCFYVPIAKIAGRRSFQLRVGPALNNQSKGVNWATTYDLGAIAQLGERPAGSRKAGGSSPPSSTSNVRPLR